MAAELITGERMGRDEFLRVWDRVPQLKSAELIDDIVFVPGPVPASHGLTHSLALGWLGVYTARTPGCRGGSNMTWLMLESAP